MTTDAISRGLDALGGGRGSDDDDVTLGPSDELNAPENIPDLSEVPHDVAGATDLAERSNAITAQFAKRLNVLQNDMARAETEIEQAADAMKFQSPAERTKHVNRAMSDRHREILTNSEPERLTHLRELQTLANQGQVADSLFESPAAMLSIHGLGTPERTEFERQLTGAGDATLRTFVNHAIATKNLALGAALVMTNDKKRANKRPFSSQQLAERLIGDQHRQAQAALAVVRNRFQEAINADRRFRTGRANGTAKIEQALAKRNEAAFKSKDAA